MRLIERDDLIRSFSERLAEASAVDVAVAWASPGQHLEILRQAAQDRNVKIRFIAGVDGNATHPVALRSILDFAELRIADSPERIFHPKFYLFHNSRGAKAWVGSANFTTGGFGGNAELVSEMDDGGSASMWFNALWSRLNENPLPAIEAYEERYTPPTYHFARIPVETDKSRPVVEHPIELLEPMPRDWASYMNALWSADRWWIAEGWHWSVFGENWSYVDTISTASAIMRKSTWADLTEKEVNVILANRQNMDGAYGLLGNMGNAGLVKQAFRRSMPVDLEIREACRSAVANAAATQGENDFIEVVIDALKTITNFERFGPGVATRLLTLACPDRAVSLNSASAAGLGQLFRLPDTVSGLGKPDVYAELLRRIHRTGWYMAPEPADSFGRQIWSMRTALLDAFVYNPS